MKFLCLVLACLAFSAGRGISAELSDLVAAGAIAEKVTGDCKFTEGPAYSPEGYLLFSDIPNSRIVKVGADGSVSDFLKPSGRSNGLVFSKEGSLFACQGGARRVVRMDPANLDNATVLAESYDGKKLNSPNDLALDAHGGLYFTDPRYGGGEPVEQPVMGVYYVAADGKVTRVIDGLERPNGILVSPDGKSLYVAEPNKRQIFRYAIEAPGTLSAGKVIFTGDAELDGGGPDGMAHDTHGNIYATYKGITVLAPDGKLIGRIPVPERPANCSFGGKDGKTLYITARKSLYSVAMNVAGLPPRSRASGKSKAVKLGGLTLSIPQSWTEEKPTSRMRVGQFQVPASGGESEPAELVVFYFGRGGAGGVGANIQRWIGQFAPAGRKVKLYSGESSTGKYNLVDLTGTYNKSIGPPRLRKSKAVPDSRVINVMIDTKEGAYFLKLAGGKKTVGASIDALRASFGADPAKEKEKGLPGEL